MKEDITRVVIGIADDLGIELQRLVQHDLTEEELAEGLAFPCVIDRQDEFDLFDQHIDEEEHGGRKVHVCGHLFKPSRVLYELDRSAYYAERDRWMNDKHRSGEWTSVAWGCGDAEQYYKTSELEAWCKQGDLATERRRCNAAMGRR